MKEKNTIVAKTVVIYNERRNNVSITGFEPIDPREEIMKCKKHPKYKAILKPRCDCKECIKIYSSKDDRGGPI